ncbi:energy-coupling factor ABC transporter permease [Tautonia plasticadhaerens]|uniref:Fused nickel transport protein NikMN n=1 Tax=Tautonia plasticadhaerens TaxID=2527974 RepID=A0A518GXJ1_9BACT|nr:energy-coupling factor ABC transporter permease [Tautonia plasticadhaerens]QDV33316.1 Fused nickel transport protein NikMN [Tautonia plasticadhaerens]
MHIPDHVLSQPVLVATGAIALGGFGYGLRRMERRLKERSMVLMGIMAAFVFAAQMVNFPLLVLPASGHLIGGVLAAVMLGPWAGAVVMGTVLIVQALMFADGGILALGANFLNLGLIASVGGYAIYEPIRRAIGGKPGVLIGAMVAAWFSVLLSSLSFAVQLAASGWWSELPKVLGWMALVHAVIGLGEAMITGLVLRSVLAVRPDLVFEEQEDVDRARGWARLVLGGLGASLAVAAFLAPLASPLDDGLEFVGGRLGFLTGEGSAMIDGPMADYTIRGMPDVAQATAAAGLIGTITVFAAGLVLGRTISPGRASRGPIDPDSPGAGAGGGPGAHAA